jgi:glutathione S-transferase
MLELYTSEPNTFFLKPLIALAEKRAPFTTRYFDATALEQFAGGFPADLESGLQLEREGPLLVHDGTLICSSFFMLEYISEALPGPSLIPADPYDAYRARAWGQYLGANLGSSVPLLGAEKYLRPHLATLDPEWLERRIAAAPTPRPTCKPLSAASRRRWRASKRRCSRRRGSLVPPSQWRTSTLMPCCACCRIWRRRWSIPTPLRASASISAALKHAIRCAPRGAARAPRIRSGSSFPASKPRDGDEAAHGRRLTSGGVHLERQQPQGDRRRQRADPHGNGDELEVVARVE